ncbi:MAG: 6-phosphogluconolactonase [Flammeovirgaceae bacterium]|nr:6-phosphogluconolactonase [Flammeovirgaceae bacterium]
MKIQIHPNYQLLSEAVADLIIHYVNSKKDALICLASGHTPLGVFEELRLAQQSEKIDLSNCRFLSLDEWIGIDPSDPGSCLSMLQKDCFGPLEIKKDQIEFFHVLISDLEAECERINKLIEVNNGLDIMLVGVGTNGHIGMNEPGTPFNTYAHISTLAEETKTVGQKYFQKTTVLSQGITLGLQHLRESKLPIVMASGIKKAPIIAKLLKVRHRSHTLEYHSSDIRWLCHARCGCS